MNGHSELVIERVTKDNSGTYSCIAENRVGTIKSLGFVYVKGVTSLPVSKYGPPVSVLGLISQQFTMSVKMLYLYQELY